MKALFTEQTENVSGGGLAANLSFYSALYSQFGVKGFFFQQASSTPHIFTSSGLGVEEAGGAYMTVMVPGSVVKGTIFGQEVTIHCSDNSCKVKPSNA